MNYLTPPDSDGITIPSQVHVESGNSSQDKVEDKGVFIQVSARIRPLISTEKGSKEVVEVTEED